MKRLFLILVILCSGILFQNCTSYKPEGQGITGTVTWLEGNKMPTVSDNHNPSNAKPIKRTLRIFPLVKIFDLKIEDGLFTSIDAKPITEVETDEKGNFNLKLSPGRYSVFVVEEGGLFASIFDGEGNAQPVTVEENEWTLLDIEVNYKAVY